MKFCGLRRGRDVLPVIDSVGNELGVRIQRSLFFHHRRRVDKNLVNRADELDLLRIQFPFNRGKRVFVVDVVTAHIVIHQVETVGKLGPPEIENDLRTATVPQQLPGLLQPPSRESVAQPGGTPQIRRPRTGAINLEPCWCLGRLQNERASTEPTNRLPPIRWTVHPHHLEIARQARSDLMTGLPARPPAIWNQRDNTHFTEQRWVRIGIHHCHLV